MAINYGPKGRIVTSADVNSVSLNNASIDTANTGDIALDGAYQLTTNHASVGCGSTGLYIELKDNIAWKFLSFEFYTANLTAACWTFCTGGYAPASGNILSYNEANGDITFFNLNSWEKPQFQSHNREYACDNNSDNFLHPGYYSGSPRIVWMRRRRNIGAGLAGVALGFACTGGGTVVTSNIRIYI